MSIAVLQNWLNDNALKIYPLKSRDIIFTQLIQAVRTFPTLQLKTDVYTYDDGRTHLLLCIHGLLPISFRSQSYNIPIVLWLPISFPSHPPIVFVRPNSDMLIKPSHIVDVSGMCNLPYLANWLAKPEACNIVSLIHAMQDAFSRSPPLYAKPPSPAPSAPRTNPNHPSGAETLPTLPPKPNATYPFASSSSPLPSSQSYVPVRSPPAANTSSTTGVLADYNSNYIIRNSGTDSGTFTSASARVGAQTSTTISTVLSPGENLPLSTYFPSAITVSPSPSTTTPFVPSATPSASYPSDSAANPSGAAVRARIASTQSPTGSAGYTVSPTSHVVTSVAVPAVATTANTASPYPHSRVLTQSPQSHAGQTPPPVPPLPVAYTPSPLQHSTTNFSPQLSSALPPGTIRSPGPTHGLSSAPTGISAVIPPAVANNHNRSFSVGQSGHVAGGNVSMNISYGNNATTTGAPQSTYAQSLSQEQYGRSADGKEQNSHLPPPYVFPSGYTTSTGQAQTGSWNDQRHFQQNVMLSNTSTDIGPRLAPTVSPSPHAPSSVPVPPSTSTPYTPARAQVYAPAQQYQPVPSNVQVQAHALGGANSALSSSSPPFMVRGSSELTRRESGQWTSSPPPGSIPVQMQAHIIAAPRPIQTQPQSHNKHIQMQIQNQHSPAHNPQFTSTPNTASVPSATNVRRAFSIPNFLDSDDTELQTSSAGSTTAQFSSASVPNTGPSTVTTSTPPPLPPNPELLTLHASILSALRSSLTTLQTTHAQTLARQRSQQQALLAGAPAIEDEMARLRAVKTVCESVSAKMRPVVEDGEKRVEYLRKMGDISVDELVCASSIAHNQLVNLVAEDNAIEDTLFHLHRALNAGRIDLERFLRTTRVLAEEQFMKRALIDKILKGVSMGSFSHSEFSSATTISPSMVSPQSGVWT